MKQPTGSYPRVRDDGRAVVSQAGSVLLVETVRKIGLDRAISAGLAPWRKPRAVHDPGKVLLDLALAVALGGGCLADVTLLRSEPAVFGPVASDPTVSRLIDTLATAGGKALIAIRAARAEVRNDVWELTAGRAPDVGWQVTVDLKTECWSSRTRTSRTPPRPGRRPTATTRRRPSSTADRAEPASRSRPC